MHQASPIGFGAMSPVSIYGPRLEKKDAIKLVRDAFEHCVTFFDIAQGYEPCLGEDLIGEAVQGFDQEQPFVLSWSLNMRTNELKYTIPLYCICAVCLVSLEFPKIQNTYPLK